MASSALVAILSLLALALLAPSTTGMTLAKHISVSTDSSSNATAQEVNLALNVLVTLPDLSAEAKAAFETLKNNSAAIQPLVKDAVESVSSSATSSAEKVEAFLDGLKEQLQSGAANVTAEVQPEVEAAVDTIKAAAGDAKDQIDSGVAAIAAAVQAKLAAAAAEAQALKTTIKDGLIALSQKVNSSLTLGLSGLKSKINDAIQKLNGTVNSGAADGAIANVGASLGGKKAAFGDILEALGQAQGNGTSDLVSSIKNGLALNPFAQAILGAGVQVGNNIKDVAQAMAGAAGGAASAFGTGIGGAASAIGGGIAGAAGAAGSALAAGGAAVGAGVGALGGAAAAAAAGFGGALGGGGGAGFAIGFGK